MVHLMRAGRVMPSLPGKTERTRKNEMNKKSEERPHRTPRRRVFLAIIIHKMLDESPTCPPVFFQFVGDSLLKRTNASRKFSLRFHNRELRKCRYFSEPLSLTV